MGEKTAKKGFGCLLHFLAKDCAEGHRRRVQGISRVYLYAHIVGRGKGNGFLAFFFIFMPPVSKIRGHLVCFWLMGSQSEGWMKISIWRL